MGFKMPDWPLGNGRFPPEVWAKIRCSVFLKGYFSSFPLVSVTIFFPYV